MVQSIIRASFHNQYNLKGKNGGKKLLMRKARNRNTMINIKNVFKLIICSFESSVFSSVFELSFLQRQKYFSRKRWKIITINKSPRMMTKIRNHLKNKVENY